MKPAELGRRKAHLGTRPAPPRTAQEAEEHETDPSAAPGENGKLLVIAPPEMNRRRLQRMKRQKGCSQTTYDLKETNNQLQCNSFPVYMQIGWLVSLNSVGMASH